MKNSQKGFSAIEGLLIIIIVGLISFVGWYVYQVRNKTSSSYNNASAAQSTTKSTKVKSELLTSTDIAKIQAEPVTAVSKQSAKATASTPKPSTSSGPSAAPTPSTNSASTSAVTISVSADGCYVTVTANTSPNSIFEVGAFTPTKGGSSSFILPSNGTLTKATGGFKGMTAFGQLNLANGIKVGYGSGTITADSCPAAN